MPRGNRHVMRKVMSDEESKKHEKEVLKRQYENNPKFTWPNTITWNDQEVTVSTKNPNFAIYMLGASQLNRRLYLSKNDYLRWLKNQ